MGRGTELHVDRPLVRTHGECPVCKRQTRNPKQMDIINRMEDRIRGLQMAHDQWFDFICAVILQSEGRQVTLSKELLDTYDKEIGMYKIYVRPSDIQKGAVILELQKKTPGGEDVGVN